MENIKNDKPVALTDWTYQYLRNQLLNMEIEPGEQMRIEDFCEILNVSRTPVREAFLKLSTEGLIKVKPRVGYFATDITEREIREVCEVREIIESRAVRKAAEELDDDDLSVLKMIMDRTRKAVKERNHSDFMESEIEFHEFLHKNFKNRLLIEFLESLDSVIYRGRVLANYNKSTLKKTLEEHEKILEAILNRDADKAAWYMGEHLQNVSDRLVELINIQNEEERKQENE